MKQNRKKTNTVFIGCSLDGYISDRNDELEWLNAIPNPENNDMGYLALMDRVDALLMGRRTFEVVCSFDMDWPYTKPVFVLSRSLDKIPEEYADKAYLVNGPLQDVLQSIHEKGYFKLYIDGGTCIQSLLREDLIDEIILSRIPVLLGGGAPLFSLLPKELAFEHVETTVFLGEIVQSHYRRKR